MNTVNPTVVLTDMTRKIGYGDPVKAGPILARIPLGKLVGELVSFSTQKCD